MRFQDGGGSNPMRMDRAPTKQIDDIVAYVLGQSNKMAQDATAEAAASYQVANTLLLSVIALAVALGAAATYWLVRSITRPLSTAVEVARTVAAGDLTSRPEEQASDLAMSASEAMRAQAANLAKALSVFKLSGCMRSARGKLSDLPRRPLVDAECRYPIRLNCPALFSRYREKSSAKYNWPR